MGTSDMVKKRRSKQINVRLNNEDALKFQNVMQTLQHQNVSDSVRDLLRIGHMDVSKLSLTEINHLIQNIPPEQSDEVKELQLNVRLNAEEHEKTEDLMHWLQVKSVSKVIRNLIAIYHYTLEERSAQQKVGGMN